LWNASATARLGVAGGLVTDGGAAWHADGVPPRFQRFLMSGVRACGVRFSRHQRQAAQVAAAVLLAVLTDAGLDRLGGHLPHHASPAPLPADRPTLAFAVALAVLVFVSRRWGAVLALLTAAVMVAGPGLPYASVLAGPDRPAAAVAAAVVAVLAVGEVALWSLWWPVMLREAGRNNGHIGKISV
jgi:hypothetical protein